jgi:hypothetical protein
MDIELATQPLWGPPNANAATAPSMKIQIPVLNHSIDSKPVVRLHIPERMSPQTNNRPGNLSSLISGVDVIAEAIESLQVDTTINDRSDSVNNEETDIGHSWSSIEDQDCERLHLDIDARDETELTLETFWDIFNHRREELCRQRGAAAQQASSSIDAGHESGNAASSSRIWSRPPNSKSHQRLNDDEDDGRVPKRRKIESELPPDRIESPRYSCPYRKHNRQRYNIHTHKTCALSWFPTIARVK